MYIMTKTIFIVSFSKKTTPRQLTETCYLLFIFRFRAILLRRK